MDLCIYGATAGGIATAVAAAHRGRSAVLIHPGPHTGGMTTHGLGLTDFGKRHVIGGMARRFYRELGTHYNQSETWTFEPHAARGVLERWIRDADVPVHQRQFLERMEMDANRITRITLLGGLSVAARIFVDATYEGDFMAAAGVTYRLGRESNRVYGETLNGVQVRDLHQFSHPIDPYREPGNPASGPLPRVNPRDAGPNGRGDRRIQAYCFRLCMTDSPDLRVPWEMPGRYDPGQYVLAARWFNSEKDRYNELILPDGELRKFDRLQPVPHKTDTNNHGPVSSDFIGANYAWPEADYPGREELYQQHIAYQKGLYWFLANDPSIPKRYREKIDSFGLAADEFEETAHWPSQLYVREARRMLGDYVLTEHDCMHRRSCEDPVGLGSYTVDSHNCQRFVRDGRVLNDGDVQVPPAGPYGVSYRSIVPSKGECGNLAVPVCCSASHIAYGSVRMEPVFMILGESAAIAADIAIEENVALQDVPYLTLRTELLNAGQILEAPNG